jgi:MoaA/NifB/PqqE/SkfB family radical SAM enzyme
MNDVYCSAKFAELQVHISSRLLYNCCKAYPERIDLDWLENNPGKLFHTPTMVQDRTEMLAGKKCKSCDWGCYKYEEQGLLSARTEIKNNGYINNTEGSLIDLQIALSTDCNLTCAYCSAEWSTSWSTDLKENGRYNIKEIDDDHYNTRVALWSKMKQKNRSTDSKFFHLVLREIELSKTIKRLAILGGEPLLNNNLISLLDRVTDKKVSITSGLGVSIPRLEKILKQIKDKNIDFIISAESTGKYFEFIRYGSEWKDFLRKTDMIKNNGNPIRFITTINNLSIFDIKSFYELMNQHHYITFNSVTNRPFLQANVLDDLSKKHFIESIGEDTNNEYYKKIIDILKIPYEEKERKNLSIFLKEFARRRSLSLDIFPNHFLKWLEII